MAVVRQAGLCLCIQQHLVGLVPKAQHCLSSWHHHHHAAIP